MDTDLRVTDMYEPESESDVNFFVGGADETATRLTGVLCEK